jgi:hypothetical protein
MLLSDGASRFEDLFELATWQELQALLDKNGLDELLRQVRAAEAADADAEGRQPLIHGRLRWRSRLPLWVLRHATVSTVPRVQAQGRPSRWVGLSYDGNIVTGSPPWCRSPAPDPGRRRAPTTSAGSSDKPEHPRLASTPRTGEDGDR